MGQDAYRTELRECQAELDSLHDQKLFLKVVADLCWALPQSSKAPEFFLPATRGSSMSPVPTDQCARA